MDDIDDRVELLMMVLTDSSSSTTIISETREALECLKELEVLLMARLAILVIPK